MRKLPHQDEPIPTKEEIKDHVTKFLKMNRFCLDNKIETFGYTCVNTDSRLGSALIACLRTIFDVDYVTGCIHLMGQEPDLKTLCGCYYDDDVVNQITDDDPAYLQLYKKFSVMFPWDS